MNINLLYVYLCMVSLYACGQAQSARDKVKEVTADFFSTSLVVLGTVQDAGSPQIGCQKTCCRDLFDNPAIDRRVVALGLYDASTDKKYLLETTPDMPRQVRTLHEITGHKGTEIPDGIFLTHGHIGHYTGLMYLGKEAMDAQETPVYVMPRMKAYLQGNGPWSQLVNRKNMTLKDMSEGQPVKLSEGLSVTPFLVPHRDEYTETVGYRIDGPAKRGLFIPDIDKWERWEEDILEQIRQVDYAFLDATFFSGEELNNRDMAEIPHPFILESLEVFESLSPEDKQKVVFIHFNHTNPVLDPSSEASRMVLSKGFRIARQGQVYPLGE